MSETSHPATVELHINGQAHELTVVEGTMGDKGIQIPKLLGTTGHVTLDVGYKNTGATTSAITFINGSEGVLLHRGYSIEELADKASFSEIMYLLLHGELPTQSQLDDLNGNLAKYAEVPAEVKTILDAMPQSSHPMAFMTTALAALSGNYSHMLDSWTDEEVRWESIYRLLGHMPTLTAYVHRRNAGLPYIDPKPELGYVENFLNMMFGEVDKDVAEAIDTLLVLHADHEQNCSASSVRLVGSSHVNLFAAVAAGNAALWGPLHGGANQKVVEMLANIIADGGDTEKYIAKAKDKSDPFRLMGFGHRVYKNLDPRAKVIKAYADKVLDALDVDDPALPIAKGLEKAALEDEYFASRKLFPNVDFYSGLIYKALDIPVDMFTVMFALGRLPGWISQWKEMREDAQPIGRPRQIYLGEAKRPYVSIENRD
ncbi:MAG: citrate synthase [Bacteroidia bacterium]